MKRTLTSRIKWALLAPLMTVYAFGSCSADTLRDTADILDNAARDIDGEERDVDLGDWLADELEDL